MGTLKPNAKYVYERANGITYAREIGASSVERFEIGRDYSRADADKLETWKDVLLAAKTNPALQQAVDRAIIIYRLSIDNPL